MPPFAGLYQPGNPRLQTTGVYFRAAVRSALVLRGTGGLTIYCGPGGARLGSVRLAGVTSNRARLWPPPRGSRRRATTPPKACRRICILTTGEDLPVPNTHGWEVSFLDRPCGRQRLVPGQTGGQYSAESKRSPANATQSKG